MASSASLKSFGAELDLRSQLLFLDFTDALVANDPITKLVSSGSTYIHESSHWSHVHGSSIGVLLTLLQRVRDASAVEFSRRLTRSDRQLIARSWRGGHSIESGLRQLAFSDAAQSVGQTWLDLYHTWQVLIDPETLDGPRSLPLRSMDSAVRTTWFQSAGKEMTPLCSSHHKPVLLNTVEGGPPPTITTRLLLECAAALDEIFVHSTGSMAQYADSEFGTMLESAVETEYGLPWRYAQRLAGREVGLLTVQALIDFALNPPVPGLQQDVDQVEWIGFYPPFRYEFACEVLGSEPAWSNPPTLDELQTFWREIEVGTGLQMGRVDTTLTTDSSLQQITESPSRFDLQARMCLFSSASLQADRRSTPERLAFFGTNFAGPGALRMLRPEAYWVEGNWWLFAPLRSADGVYAWPSERLTQDAATELLLEICLNVAMDDLMLGLGESSGNHLPLGTLGENNSAASMVEEAFHSITKVPLRFNYSPRKFATE